MTETGFAVGNALETLRFEPHGGGLVRFDAHLARLARTAAWLEVPFRRQGLRAAVLAACKASPSQGTLRVRLELRPDGQVMIDVRPLEPPSTIRTIDTLTELVESEALTEPVDPSSHPPTVAIAHERVVAADPWLRRKTTRRPLYEPATAVARRLGLADVVFLNERAEVADGAISTVFVALEGATGRSGTDWTTPPLSAGALPGILRSELLRSGQARVGRLSLDQLRGAERVVIGSSLRGLRSVALREEPVQVLHREEEPVQVLYREEERDGERNGERNAGRGGERNGQRSGGRDGQ